MTLSFSINVNRLEKRPLYFFDIYRSVLMWAVAIFEHYFRSLHPHLHWSSCRPFHSATIELGQSLLIAFRPPAVLTARH
jgi:hypothetical protein